MNFLAHLWLSGAAAEVRVGGFLGDFAKGRLDGGFPPDIEAGIALHRYLDARTDHDRAVRASVERFPREFRRYAPIIVDVLWDHYLACHFEHFADGALTTFTQAAYIDLARHRALMPPPAERFRARMTADDLLTRYRDIDTVHGALTRLGTRLSRNNPLHRSDGPITRLAPALEADFFAAFPAIAGDARRWREAHPRLGHAVQLRLPPPHVAV